MPLLYGKCCKCQASKKFLTADTLWDNISAVRKVCSCGGNFERDARGVNSMVMEVLDNGVMPRAVERLADIEELKRERLRNADENAGKSNRT
jgi:hypothetical protein